MNYYNASWFWSDVTLISSFDNEFSLIIFNIINHHKIRICFSVLSRIYFPIFSSLLPAFSKKRKSRVTRVTVRRIIWYRFRWEKFCGHEASKKFFSGIYPYPSPGPKAKDWRTCYCNRCLLSYSRAYDAYIHVSCSLEQRPSVSAELFSILPCHICLYRICHNVLFLPCVFSLFRGW